jgi:hypothetical protein
VVSILAVDYFHQLSACTCSIEVLGKEKGKTITPKVIGENQPRIVLRALKGHMVRLFPDNACDPKGDLSS